MADVARGDQRISLTVRFNAGRIGCGEMPPAPTTRILIRTRRVSRTAALDTRISGLGRFKGTSVAALGFNAGWN